ncbi:hypothetical protein ACET3X_001902 [Alternaria dauci]|uniref:Uncharacterized protein n=1 Tax=Alternaria dauci TaxID=48095 RepID=A0ABR3UZL3_9PLEO
MKEKIETSRYYRALRSAVNQRLVDLDEEDRRIETLQREQHQEMKRILDILDEDDREPTTEEELKVRSLSAEIDEEALQRKDMDAEREYLPKYLSHFARKWLELVEHVEAVEDEVLTSCKLLSKFEDKIEVPWQELPIGPGQPSLASRIPLWPLSIPPTNTVDTVKPATPDQDEDTHSRLAEKARSTRHAFQAACERHDNYRREYGSRLKHYIAQQANGTGADLEADFAKHWLEGWRGLIRDVDSAEKAAIKATDDARAANVTIFDPMDDQESNSAYSVDRRNIKSMKQLDRSQIERWNTSVVAGVWGPEHPAGDDEAELEEQAEAKQLGQRAAEISTSKYEPAAMMPQKDLSIAREQITIGQAALRVPQDKSTPLQRIEQILTEVRAALSRTDESTSPHAGEPGLMNVVAVEEAPKVFNQSSATGENCFPEDSGAHKVTEGTAEVLNKSPKRKRSEDDGTTQEEPASKRHGGEMNRKWDEDLYEYMQKYKIESPPVSKKRNQDNILLNRIILVTDSDRAYGHEQRCIDEWSYKVRDGDC